MYDPVDEERDVGHEFTDPVRIWPLGQWPIEGCLTRGCVLGIDQSQHDSLSKMAPPGIGHNSCLRNGNI